MSGTKPLTGASRESPGYFHNMTAGVAGLFLPAK